MRYSQLAVRASAFILRNTAEKSTTSNNQTAYKTLIRKQRQNYPKKQECKAYSHPGKTRDKNPTYTGEKTLETCARIQRLNMLTNDVGHHQKMNNSNYYWKHIKQNKLKIDWRCTERALLEWPHNCALSHKRPYNKSTPGLQANQRPIG